MTRTPLFLAAALALALAAPAAAQAGEPVDLRAQPMSHGASVTLGDLFDGAEGAAAQVVVGHAASGPGLQAVLEAERVQTLARNAGLDWDNAHGMRRIIVTSGEANAGRESRPRTHAAGAHRRGHQALVYARNIMSGEVLAASDLEWSDDAVAAADSPGDPDAVIGKAARRPLREGAAIEVHDLASPLVVHRNDTVNVAYDSDGVTLTLEAKAMADGAVGDTLQVVNPQSKKVIDAVVSGPGRAVVGPEAQSLKTAALGSSFRTALQ